MEFYTARVLKFTSSLKKLKKQYNTISALRLLSVVCIFLFGYFALKEENNIFWAAAVLSLFAFIYFMRRHGFISKNKVISQALLNINKNEIIFLKREGISFEDGTNFIDTHHAYSHDLDIFGRNSLFHNLNRTVTYKGKEMLAKALLTNLPAEEIKMNQEAIKELASKPEWRQEIMALGQAHKDNKEVYEKLINWSKNDSHKLPVWVTVFSYLLPALWFASLLLYFFTGDNNLLSWSGYLFVINLGFLSVCSKMIKNEIEHTTQIHEILYNYSVLIEHIHKENFESVKLRSLQQKFDNNGQPAGRLIKKLSDLFSRMDTINNLFAVILLNGTFLFHIHTLRALLKWKEKYASIISQWLDVIGEFESLGSFANLYYNNPDFTFPDLNDEYKIIFKNVAHPLLNPVTRIGNDIDFKQPFIILTGSNMSGKSTFLRSLGVNMALAGAGAPVCAKEASIHPLPVLVSMRLSDSLTDSESYFYAEIKRLKQIMDNLENQRAFVLLDEILRGTNSDDKRTGTIEVVKKMVASKAIGAIATHDIEVCNTTNTYPDYLHNSCFEAQIIDDDLFFDYKLRDGICKNKSATFLMQKTGVI